MNISKQEAEASLADIEDIIAKTRRVIAAGHSANQLILWGIIWVIGYGYGQFDPPRAGIVWLPLTLGGFLLSMRIGSRRHVPTRSPLLGRLGAFFGLLFGYAFLWIFILQPVDPRRMGPYMATVAMFSYCVGGIFFDRFFLWLGLAVTALTLVGMHFVPAWLNLWMAVACGGSLIAAGLYIRARWR